uniref:Putative secreted protein n=1 Tax=Ixodes ricinus TaxID=34613 RepID=A0A6B0UKA4_IXORI
MRSRPFSSFFCLFYLCELGSACSRVGGAFPRKRYGQLCAGGWRGFRARFMRWRCVGISSATVRCVVVCYCVSCDEPDSSIGFSLVFGSTRWRSRSGNWRSSLTSESTRRRGG